MWLGAGVLIRDETPSQLVTCFAEQGGDREVWGSRYFGEQCRNHQGPDADICRRIPSFDLFRVSACNLSVEFQTSVQRLPKVRANSAVF